MNDETTPNTPRFDLFATEVEDNLKEELAKGTFQWTNKYTRILGGLFVIVGLLAVGTWYGHYEATKSTTTSVSSRFSSLRAAFGGGGFGGFGGFGGGTSTTGGSTTGTAGASGGGFGGFGGTRVTGTIKSINGSTVTITLDDPTQSSTLTAGDQARVTDTGNAGGTSSSGTSTSTTPINPPANNGTSTSGSTTTNTAPAPAASPAATNSTARRRGAFSNPQLTACLKKAGITIAAGSRPNFQDPATAQALQTCFTQLGITPGGGFGGARGAAPTPAATK
jgi:hypothetical protein